MGASLPAFTAGGRERVTIRQLLTHVSGLPDQLPGNDELRKRHAPLEDFLDLAAHLGMERYVFVQPSAYGRNNDCMLDAMRTGGAAKCRGIVDIAQRGRQEVTGDRGDDDGRQ